eukprot:1457518-Amphidinium_carterae.1
MTKVVKEATESRSQQKAQYELELGRLQEEVGRLVRLVNKNTQQGTKLSYQSGRCKKPATD